MTYEQDERTEETLSDILASAVSRSNRTDVPSISERARKEAELLVGRICEEARAQLQSRRDEIDNLMERIDGSKDKLIDMIVAFSTFSANSITVSNGIKEAISIIGEQFSQKPSATLTQRSNGNNHN